MPAGLRLRFWLESVLGSITGILAVVTLFWHDWIEAVFGADPDKGNGSRGVAGRHCLALGHRHARRRRAY